MDIQAMHLVTSEEYSVYCDECDRESTRDSREDFALKLATNERFEVVGKRVLCMPCREVLSQHEKDCRCEDCESSRIDEVMAAEKERPDFEERLAEATTLTAVRFDFRRREREAI